MIAGKQNIIPKINDIIEKKRRLNNKSLREGLLGYKKPFIYNKTNLKVSYLFFIKK